MRRHRKSLIKGILDLRIRPLCKRPFARCTLHECLERADSSHPQPGRIGASCAATCYVGNAQLATFAKSWSAGHLEAVNGPKLSFPVW